VSVGTSNYLDAATTYANAVAALDAYDPSTWTFTAAGTPANDAVFAQFSGETLLAAAIIVAERSGTHFYLSAEKTLTLTSDWAASGVHLVAPGGGVIPDATVGVIQSISKTEQSFDLATRIYPYGKLGDGTPVGIQTANVSDPTGYTINEADNYVKHDGSESTYGVISRYIVYDEINIDDESVSRTAANALVQAALLDLARMNEITTNYTITLGGLSVLLTPLQTVHVYWRNDGLSVRETLKILETTWRGDAAGMATVGIVAAANPYWVKSDADKIVEAMARVERLAAR
jgi:hypothetical protein